MSRCPRCSGLLVLDPARELFQCGNCRFLISRLAIEAAKFTPDGSTVMFMPSVAQEQFLQGGRRSGKSAMRQPPRPVPNTPRRLYVLDSTD